MATYSVNGKPYVATLAGVFISREIASLNDAKGIPLTIYELNAIPQKKEDLFKADSAWRALGGTIRLYVCDDWNPNEIPGKETIKVTYSIADSSELHAVRLGDAERLMLNALVIQFRGIAIDNENKKDNLIEFGPYKWKVLAKDDSKMLLITQDIIAAKQYDETGLLFDWSNSRLRNWMNGELQERFSKEDQERMLMTQLSDTETSDKLFLLSREEVYKYFTTCKDRLCRPNDDAIKEGIWMNSKGTSEWWLRTAERNIRLNAPIISSYWSIYESGYMYDWQKGDHICGVRPAVWIKK